MDFGIRAIPGHRLLTAREHLRGFRQPEPEGKRLFGAAVVEYVLPSGRLHSGCRVRKRDDGSRRGQFLRPAQEGVPGGARRTTRVPLPRPYLSQVGDRTQKKAEPGRRPRSTLCSRLARETVKAARGRAPAAAGRATEGETGLCQNASTDSADTKTTTEKRRGRLGRPVRVLAPSSPRGRAPRT
jgi:hypothetical protein